MMKRIGALLALLILPLTLLAQRPTATPLTGYFYRTDIPTLYGGPTLLTIRTQAEFEARFQPGNTKGESLERPDFSKEIVLAIVLPPTDQPAEQLAITTVRAKGDDGLIVKYTNRPNKKILLDQPIVQLALARVSGTHWKNFSFRTE